MKNHGAGQGEFEKDIVTDRGDFVADGMAVEVCPGDAQLFIEASPARTILYGFKQAIEHAQTGHAEYNDKKDNQDRAHNHNWLSIPAAVALVNGSVRQEPGEDSLVFSSSESESAPFWDCDPARESFP